MSADFGAGARRHTQERNIGQSICNGHLASSHGLSISNLKALTIPISELALRETYRRAGTID
jgi:hypothetical protein